MSPQSQKVHMPIKPSAEYIKKTPDPEQQAEKNSSHSRSRTTFWVLLLIGIVLNVAVIALGAYKVFFAPKTVAPPPDRKIAVPYSGNKALWQTFHQWVVQDDGRNKPYQTFCAETVRAITGREKFEKNDPVAIVTSWLLLHDSDLNDSILASRAMNCDWEYYPFILCDHHRLRKLLYKDHKGVRAKLTDQDLYGKYIEPAVLRNSNLFKKILATANEKKRVNNKAVLTELEQKAQQVQKRYAIYERVRKGGQDAHSQVRAPGSFAIVALDPHGPTWFSLRAIREINKDEKIWKQTMQARALHSPQTYQGKGEPVLPKADLKELASAQKKLKKAYRSKDAGQLSQTAQSFFTTVAKVSSSHAAYPGTTSTGMELWFNQANPFRKAWIFSLFASLLLLSSMALKARWATIGKLVYYSGLLVYLVAIGWSVAGFYCRAAISGRPPVGNMYESVIWVAFMTAVFGFVLEMIFRRGVIALAGALVSTFGLILADQLPMVLTPNIQPLQAVLRSNYWLIIHVLTIVSSYSAFALAWGIGNFNLGLMLFAPQRRDLVKSLSSFCYRAIQIGVVLLAAGTLLGGFWAAESWGRFWGWDPKEVWALIALLCYIIPLHARYIGGVKDFGLAVCSVVCFASVVMAWYGVNFILGAGLHSYGFGAGNDFWVYWAGLLNIALVVHAALRYRYMQRVKTEG